MARSRLIKPGFFENEDLCSLPYEARLLFAGLWTIADRAGRLEDRPVRIRAKLFPYDNIDIDKLLTALQSKGFVLRYTVESERYLAVLKFDTHQHPHVKEPTSTIPAPDKHQISTMLERCKHHTSPAVIDPVIDPVSRSGSRTNTPTVSGINGNGHKTASPGPVKEQPDPRVKEFIAWFQNAYKTKRNGADYMVKWEKDAPNVKKLLKATSMDRLQKCAQILLSEKTDDDFIVQSDRGIGVLSAKFNWLSERLAAWEARQRASA